MSIAALYDIHGNLPALEAVLCCERHVGLNSLTTPSNMERH
jgi:hypothetical protein